MSVHNRGRKPAAKATEVRLLTRTPSPPAYLPDEAKKAWREVAALLVDRRVLAKSDLQTLENYAIAVANIRIITSGKGKKDQHGTLKQAQDTQRQLACELGLSPTARGRIGVEPSDNDEDFDALGF